MNVIIYSQNIWGVGHFFRSLEICKAMAGHDIILVTGGDRIDVPLPDHIREIRLPGIMTDREYKSLFTTENMGRGFSDTMESSRTCET